MEQPPSTPPPALPVDHEPAASPTNALLAGLRRALRYWPVLLALWLGTLFTALPLAFVPARQLLALADRPVIAGIAGGVEARHVLDVYGLMVGGQAGALLGQDDAGPALETPPALRSAVSGLTWAVLLVPLLGGVISAFLYGGALRTYREAPAPFRFTRFLSDCWRWFGAFLLLGFLQAGLFVVLLLPVSLLALGVGANLGPAGFLPAALLVALLLAVWLLLFETARVQTVVSGARNPFRGLGRALVLFVRRPGALLGFYALALIGLLGLHALYRLALLPLVPAGLFLPALLIQQSFIILRLLARAARLAGLIELFRNRLQKGMKYKHLLQ